MYTCLEDACPYKVKSESRFKEHYKYSHWLTTTGKCTMYKRMFQTPSHMDNHKKSSHR